MTRIKLATGSTGGNGSHAASHYGARGIEDVLGSKYQGENGKNILSYTFSYDDLPVVTLDEAAQTIPANSFIVSATLRTIIAIAGTTPTLTLGLTEKDGTAIDADGIDVAIAAAALSVVGETVLCDGALVASLQGTGAERGQLVATTGGTVTAGKFSLEIEYKELLQRA
jgi:hypothetical protein